MITTELWLYEILNQENHIKYLLGEFGIWTHEKKLVGQKEMTPVEIGSSEKLRTRGPNSGGWESKWLGK